MDETEILKANRKRKLALGYLIVEYTIIKKLGPLVAIVYERLVTECNYAVRNKLKLYYDYFGYEIEEIAGSLGLMVEEVSKALDKLENERLIERTEINGYKLIYIYYKFIIFCKKGRKRT